MMSRLLLFNPQNDLALAANIARFTPPANAARLVWAGRMLPLWYGDSSDYVIAEDVSPEWLFALRRDFAVETEIYKGESEQLTSCCPWGWSLDARARFASVGVANRLLPSDDALMRLRNLSHRRLTVEVVKRLSRRVSFTLPPVPVEAFSVDDCVGAVASFGGRAYVKLPYSSTGRGVVNFCGLSSSDIVGRVEGMIRRQDSVMVEKALDKVLDFAMLFHAGNGRVSLSGYSAFVAENGVAYSGNLVMPDCKIKNEYIGRYISPSVLDELESALPPILSELIGDIYNGYFGVDMMVYRDDSGDYAVAPCVEVNLRMTMGVVAHRLGKRYVSPDVDARMKVTFGRYFTDGDAVIDGGRLVSGSMSLIEPDPYFSITLEVIKR